MRTPIAAVAALAVLLPACGPEPKPAPTVAVKPAAPRPHDESSHLPLADRVDTKVVDEHLLGQSFMPGGTLGTYRKGKLAYEMFVARTGSPLDAAVLLPDWQKALAGAKLVPAFGAYYGELAGRPVFVFTKGAWIAGIAGLNEKQADLPARALATRLN